MLMASSTCWCWRSWPPCWCWRCSSRSTRGATRPRCCACRAASPTRRSSSAAPAWRLRYAHGAWRRWHGLPAAWLRVPGRRGRVALSSDRRALVGRATENGVPARALMFVLFAIDVPIAFAIAIAALSFFSSATGRRCARSCRSWSGHRLVSAAGRAVLHLRRLDHESRRHHAPAARRSPTRWSATGSAGSPRPTSCWRR